MMFILMAELTLLALFLVYVAIRAIERELLCHSKARNQYLGLIDPAQPKARGSSA
jgi:hypothetical protein